MTPTESGSVAEIRAIVLDFSGTLAQDDHLVAPLHVEMFSSPGAAAADSGARIDG